MSTIHVEPINDLIAHVDHDCPCGPTVEAVFRDNPDPADLGHRCEGDEA